jgi:hypothetical protein
MPLVSLEAAGKQRRSKRMNAARSKSAWLALLAAGGLYAWNNRDKIRGWLNTQREQLSTQSGSSLPSTGATRRIDQQDYSTPNNTRGIYNEPFNNDV